ncbi:MAG: sigma-54-dependent Fis family transcriptional regulator [Deltaproteobacteria bacterium]|nr:sigma-54-dependent Fis family transcriptional regulator [Deltaproteobacteria bacterium]
MQHNILLVDDDLNIRNSMVAFLNDEGFSVRAVESGEEAIAIIRQGINQFSLGMIDFHMPGMSGPEVIKEIKAREPNLAILGFSGDDSVEAHNQSLDSGAVFFVEKDIGNAKLLGIIHRLCREVEKRTKPVALFTENANRKLIESVDMVGISNALADTANLILRFASSKETVLIRGENGTGKEKVARAIHKHSPRALMPFIAVNCASIPEALIESELFGHEKGAFTGANRTRVGFFQAANGGTIFLDEIGELPMHLQATLLRVLQEKTIMPVGSNIAKKIDFRLIAATNAPIGSMIANRQFREDLFYRLNVLPINLKPLRERPEDISYLAEIFIKRANQEERKNKILLEATVEEFKKMHWKGNVRELEHCIKHLVSASVGDYLDLSILKDRIYVANNTQKLSDINSIKAVRENEDKILITETLQKSKSISGAARATSRKW